MKKPYKLAIVICAVLLLGTGYWYWHNQLVTTDDYWRKWDENSRIVIDQSLWQQVLDDYLIEDETGIHLVDYEGLEVDGAEELEQYIQQLTHIDPAALNRDEQLAYWINLYNALTIRLIVRHYPVASITALGETIGSFGPWDDEIVEIARRKLSLNDIEHGIIRPVYQDYRIHFAVNCASIGCPNLSTQAYLGETISEQLDEAAAKFISHPRGLRYDGNQLYLSRIFEWYQEDFGSDFGSALTTILRHAGDGVIKDLSAYDGAVEYEYDWRLNGL